ncbi:MAG: LacI family DNA-binding transcriptional regulator [Eubacteriales bacterium]|nr:LacI family DNA-binding transcriptional regulator [Eubacteriales bacterium]
MTKLKDIAVVAGVSISTVSKALNNSHEIKDETRMKIVRIARELNYHLPPPQKDGPGKNKQSIGVICPEVYSNYYTQLISSIGAQITKRGYSYTFAVSDFKTEKEMDYLRIFGGQQIDGIILISENSQIQDTLEGIQEIWNIPLVLITIENQINHFDCIWIDDYYGASTGVEYLVKLGHRQIGYIGDHLTENRFRAFRDVMQKNQLPLIDSIIKISDYRFEDCGYRSMKTILDAPVRPTAIFAAYDDIAIGALRAVTERNLSVPDDISIMGMDNVAVCPYLSKALTTVSNPIKEMAVVTVSILFRKIKDKHFTVIQNVALKPSLIKRETTAKIKADS